MTHKPVRMAAFAGLWGAALLFVIQLILQATKIGGPPTGVAFAAQILNLKDLSAIVIGLMLFALAGLIWGIVYVLVVHRITPMTGMVFSILPSLVALLVVLPILGKPVFAGGDIKGIVMPFVLNAIWGAFVGGLTPALAAQEKAMKETGRL